MKFWQTIQFKIIFTLSCIFFVITALITYINYNFSRQELIKTLKTSAFHLNESVENSLEIAMLSGERHVIQSHIEKIVTGEHILDLFIADKSGVIRAASDRSRIGNRLLRNDPFCRFCHLKEKIKENSNTIFSDSTGNKILRTVTCIKNKKECFTCHPKKDAVLGIMILDYPITPYEKEFRKFGRRTAFSGIILILALSMISIMFIRRLVIKNVQNLVEKIRSIGAGKYFENSLKYGNDEFGIIAESIEKMEKEVQKSFFQLEKNKQYFQKIIDSIQDGLIVVDSNLKIVLVNQQLLKASGKNESEIIGTHCYESLRDSVCCAKDDNNQCCPSREVFKSKKFIQKKEEITCKGEKKFLEISSYPLIWQDDKVLHVVEIIHDITEREKLEQEIRQSEKMAAIGRLAAGIAHEINNPLATIATCVEGLNNRLGSETEKKPAEDFFTEYLHRINQSVYRCKNIIDKLLVFSRLPKNIKQEFDLNPVVKETIAVVQIRAKKEKKKINFYQSEKPLTISGEPNQISQVIMNVLINSLDAIPEESAINVYLRKIDSSAVIIVQDEGVGISENDLPHIFEPFFTTKPPGKGTGLGLSISQQIIEDHGGAIHVNSIKDEGTEVQIVLPLKQNRKK